MNTNNFKISASKVAGFIGRHKYQEQNKIIKEIMRSNKIKVDVDKSTMVRDLLCNNTKNQVNQLLKQPEELKKLLNIDTFDKDIITKELKKISFGIKNNNVEDMKKYEKLFDIDIREIKKECKGFKNCQIGIKSESSDIKKYKKKFNTKSRKDNTLYKKFINDNIYIVGLIDSKDDEHVIEHKRRMKRIFQWIPLYEKIQIHVYMWLLGLKKTKLVQTYKDEIKETIIEYDELFMEDILDTIVETYNKKIKNLLS